MNPYHSLIAPILDVFPALSPDDLVFGLPPKLDLGDVAIPMFVPAKKIGVAPPKLAAELAAKTAFGPEVASAAPAGPYLNLRLDRAAVSRRILNAILADGARFGSSGAGAGKRVVIEHTSINPNASPHVGRARNAMIGDSLTRLLRFEGYEVKVHYYVNDMGRQIGLLVLIADELQNMTFDQVLEAYVAANARAERDPGFAEQGYALLARMEEGDPETQAKFRAVTDLCLRGQIEVIGRLGARYDVFDRESKYVKDARLDHVVAALRERGAVFTDEENRLVVDLSRLGYEREEGRYFVLMRANGSSMYGFRDLAYTIDKMALGADLNLWVLGEDHKLYAQQCALILQAAGYSVPEPVYYSYILLKDGKMSTRQGNVVLLSDFLDQAESIALEKVREQCKDLGGEEQQAIAAQVAVAAIRFAVLKVTPGKNVTFEMDTALSFQGDTGPYIQYSCARINSILRKYGQSLGEFVPDSASLSSDAEWLLITKLASFPVTLSTALTQRSVAPIAVFALETARAFTGFYHDCPVLTAESPALVEARALLCRATLQILTNALAILGIEAPERM